MKYMWLFRSKVLLKPKEYSIQSLTRFRFTKKEFLQSCELILKTGSSGAVPAPVKAVMSLLRRPEIHVGLESLSF